MSKPIERVEIITGIHRRRRYTAEEKVRLVEQTMPPGMTVSAIARLHGVSPSLLFQWRRRMAEGGQEAVRSDEAVVPISRVRELENRVRELERLLGRKIMETKILITDARPTYGYRRVTALLNRARRSSGEPPLNHKRVFRLMRRASLLLQPHTGRRAIRTHEGTVVAAASNQRWASDGFEIPCRNGEVVRVTFAIDTHDREVMAWVGTSGGGVCGEMIRDMMLD